MAIRLRDKRTAGSFTRRFLVGGVFFAFRTAAEKIVKNASNNVNIVRAKFIARKWGGEGARDRIGALLTPKKRFENF